MGTQFEILADCPICLCEGSVIEVYDPGDPAAPLGVAAEARCRLCNAQWHAHVTPGPGATGSIASHGTGRCPGCRHTLLDVEVQSHACGQCGTRARHDLQRSPDALGERTALERALTRFALEESERDVLGFVASNFTAETVDGVLACIVRREPIETSFAAMHTLFNRHGGRGGAPTKGGGGTARRESRAPEALGPGVHLPVPAAPVFEPRAMLLALVSVVVADGEVDPGERAFIERFAQRENIAPARDDEYVLHRPVELAGMVPPERRRELLEAMTELACLDGVVDSSEIRIVRAYGSMWGLDDDEMLAEWIARFQLAHATRARRFFMRVKDFFLAPPPPEQDERTAARAEPPARV